MPLRFSGLPRTLRTLRGPRRVGWLSCVLLLWLPLAVAAQPPAAGDSAAEEPAREATEAPLAEPAAAPVAAAPAPEGSTAEAAAAETSAAELDGWERRVDDFFGAYVVVTI